MKIPRYWARSDPRQAVACWHWSDVSVEDAKRQAEARATTLTAKLQSGAPLDRYAYGERPLREEIVQTLPSQGGDVAAVITRNLYGALVLNAARAMFIDVDFPGGQAAPSRGLFGRLLKKAPSISPEEQALEKIQAWAANRASLSLRVYRTCAGLRCLITNQIFDPASPQTIALLNDAGSDPLYVRLCQAQSCFRARLTPKPWRCGVANPRVRYPWISSQDESEFRQWQADYERSIQKYSVCRFLQQFGSPNVRPEIAPIIALHDQFTCTQSERPLA